MRHLRRELFDATQTDVGEASSKAWRNAAAAYRSWHDAIVTRVLCRCRE